MQVSGGWVRVIWRAGFAVLVGLLPQTAFAQGPFFPDLAFDPDDKGIHTVFAEHLSGQLGALKQPSLWEKSREDRSATSYRFLWLGTGEHPTAVRISRSGEQATAHLSRHDQHPGPLTEKDQPRLIIDREAKLPLGRWNDIVDGLEAAKFWADPADTKMNYGIADGDLLVIEGIKAGKYHVVVRARQPDGKAYEPIFKMLFEATDPEILQAWNDPKKRSSLRDFFEKLEKK